MIGPFRKKDDSKTKCKKCGLDLHTPERLERHRKKAHGRTMPRRAAPDNTIRDNNMMGGP